MTVLSASRGVSPSIARFLASYPARARIYGQGEIGTEMFTIRKGEETAVRVTMPPPPPGSRPAS